MQTGIHYSPALTGQPPLADAPRPEEGCPVADGWAREELSLPMWEGLPVESVGRVGEVCAVAYPDEHSGEVVRVLIVRKDPALTKEQVIEHCKKNLTGYKVPKIVEFWKELPKTNVGKVLRREVKDTPLKS